MRFNKNIYFILCLVFLFGNSLLVAEVNSGHESNVSVFDSLREGNKQFVSEYSKMKTFEHADAFVLSCIDARVPVEKVFNQENGKVYVGRVAGNTVDVDILGSMEFAAKVKQIKLILVLGHTDCGAVKGSIDGVKLGNLTELLSKIYPSVKYCLANKKYDKISSTNLDLLNDVTIQNVKSVINDIRTKSPVISQLEKDQKLEIKGGIYHINSGEVTFLD